jgi:hypothetical protein
VQARSAPPHDPPPSFVACLSSTSSALDAYVPRSARRIRTSLRRRDVVPCALGESARCDATWRARSDTLAIAFTASHSASFFFLHIRIRICLRRRDVVPCALGESTRCDATWHAHSDTLVITFTASHSAFVFLFRIRARLCRRDVVPCALRTRST